MALVSHIMLEPRNVPDIRFRLAGYPAIFLLSGSGSGKNIGRRIVQPNNLLI